MQPDKFTYTIQYQDVDEQRRLRLYTLENYLLNSAGLSADLHGFGVKYLHPQHLTWVLTNLSLLIHTLPAPGDEMVVETWVQEHIHTLSIRNFRIYINGTLQGEARSVWAVLNTDDRTIQNVFHLPAFQLDQPGEALDIPRPARHIPITHPDLETTYRIAYSDIDYNGHCNSCKYLEHLLNLYAPIGSIDASGDAGALARGNTGDAGALARGNAGDAGALARGNEYCYNGTHTLRLDLRYAREVYKNDQVRIIYAKQQNPTLDNTTSPNNTPSPTLHCYDIYTPTGELSCSAIISTI